MMRLATIACSLFLASRAVAGYDVHITRRSDWSDKSGSAITLAEWKKVVAADSEMRLDNFAEAAASDGKKIRIESEGLAVWTKWSKHGKDGNMAWFYYSDGDVSVKNPDKEILGKMFRIAQKLGAQLQGDDGEFYDARGEILK
jgi:hypothetical protein